MADDSLALFDLFDDIFPTTERVVFGKRYYTNHQCKALKGIQNSNPSQWPGLILFSSTTGLMTNWVLHFFMPLVMKLSIHVGK